MRVSSWATVEEQVNRALALEVVSNVFPPVETQNVKGLEQDTNRLVTALRSLPIEFDQAQLDEIVGRTKLRLPYRDSLSHTLAHLLNVNTASASELSLV